MLADYLTVFIFILLMFQDAILAGVQMTRAVLEGASMKNCKFENSLDFANLEGKKHVPIHSIVLFEMCLLQYLSQIVHIP